MRSTSRLGLILATVALAPLSSADLTTTIDAKSNFGIWEGWGTSLAWWAQAFGTRDDLADLFFTTKTVAIAGQALPGLGFTIARYNAGACSSNTYNGSRMVVSSKMIPSRQMQGFWIDWASSDPTSKSWDWSVDAAQRAMLEKARDRGADVLELFSNSPMWWMCNNHNPSGSPTGKTDNLQSWNHAQHALYLATVASHLLATRNLTFQAIDPFNEPSADWWKADTGTQEGCHFSVASQASVIGHLFREIQSRPDLVHAGTFISASDETSYDSALATLNGLGAAAVAQVARVNVHGYQYDGGRRDGLAAAVGRVGKKLWQSEYGEGDGTGQRMASNMLLDFRWMRPTAWVYWQVLDGGGWGLLDADNGARTIKGVNQKYWVLAQWARHIRPGMRVLDGGGDYVVAAYDEKKRKLVVVVVNWGNAQVVNVDLKKFGTPGVEGAVVKRWVTQIGTGGSRYAEFGDVKVSGGKFSARFEKNAVQTFEVEGVVV